MVSSPSPMRAILARGAVMPIIAIDDPALAAELAQRLVSAGLTVFEVLMRSPNALACVSAMIDAAPDASIGAGTIMTTDDLARARYAGAKFGVSPGLTRTLGEAIMAAQFPFIPGVSSASECMAARDLGFRELKLFPANLCGGTAWLQAVAAIFPDTVFCPTGGIRPPDIPGYLAEPNCVTVGGSWIVPKDALASRDWARIDALAHQAKAFSR